MVENERWTEFVNAYCARVPGMPSNPTPDFDVTRHGVLDHTQRTALRRAARWLHPDLDLAALDGCRTLGEMFALTGPPVADGRPRRRAYAGKDARLRPVRRSDYGLLYESALDPASAFRWRFRGTTPSPESFEAGLYAGVLCQFIVESTEGQPFGLVSAYNHRPDVRAVSLALQRLVSAEGKGGEMIVGLAFMLDYLFTNFDLRRVTFEVPEYNRYLLDGLMGSVVELQAEIPEFLWYRDRYWSMLHCTLDKAQWDEVAGAIFASDSADI